MEQVKRKVHYEAYLIAVLLASLFFISGMFVVDYFSYNELKDISVYQKAISAFLAISELKGETLDAQISNYCELSWEDVWLEKVEVGNLLVILESKLGKDDPAILEQKKIYNEIQYRTFYLVNKINNNCTKNWDIILFFYTNDKKSDSFKRSELQGYVLDSIYEYDKEKIKIFAFDVALADPNTIQLIQEYNVTSTPALVINGETYNEFINKNGILEILQKN
jgi:hypothetical protein